MTHLRNYYSLVNYNYMIYSFYVRLLTINMINNYIVL